MFRSPFCPFRPASTRSPALSTANYLGADIIPIGCAFPHSLIESRNSIMVRPFGVSVYSTLGRGSGYDVLSMIPSRSSSRSCSVNIFQEWMVNVAAIRYTERVLSFYTKSIDWNFPSPLNMENTTSTGHSFR